MSSKPIDSLLFDVDGTIWDSTFVICKAWNAVLAGNGYGMIHLTADDLKREFGKPLDVIADDLIPSVPLADRKNILAQWVEHQAACILTDPPLIYEGLEEALAQLSKKYPLFVVSNSQVGYIESMFDVTGLGKYFVDHVCNGDTGLAKDGNITYMAEKHHLQNPAYIGDIQGDYLATRKAGVDFIYAAYGFGEVPVYEYRIDKPLDLLKLDF